MFIEELKKRGIKTDCEKLLKIIDVIDPNQRILEILNKIDINEILLETFIENDFISFTSEDYTTEFDIEFILKNIDFTSDDYSRKHNKYGYYTSPIILNGKIYEMTTILFDPIIKVNTRIVNNNRVISFIKSMENQYTFNDHITMSIYDLQNIHYRRNIKNNMLYIKTTIENKNYKPIENIINNFSVTRTLVENNTITLWKKSQIIRTRPNEFSSTIREIPDDVIVKDNIDNIIITKNSVKINNKCIPIKKYEVRPVGIVIFETDNNNKYLYSNGKIFNISRIINDIEYSFFVWENNLIGIKKENTCESEPIILKSI